ncbi:MAG: PEP/pyruvate-binding domain-containing protein [Phycisphaerae bacterium]
MNAILFPDGPGERASLGGKGAALASLLDVNLPVPPFFVLTPQAFFDALNPAQQDIFHAAATPAAIATILPTIQLTPSQQIDLLAAYDRLCPQGQLVAVRSSAVDEDSVSHSFAGQLDSFLFVSRAQLADKVAAVWHSGFSERILAYRRQHQLALKPTPPAVLIQQIIPADVAGVAFSTDPVTGRQGVVVVSAVFGLGSALVSGEADADTFSLDRAGTVLDRRVVHKRSRHAPDPLAPEGIRTVPLDPALAAAPTLTDAQLRQIATLARHAAHHFGRPQDIEWAIHANRLYLLQSRAITSLGQVPDPDGTLQIWDNANIAESYSGITTPLTFSFARHAYEGVYQQFCRLMGVSERIIADRHTVFANMLGLVRGRVYYNLLNWYRLLSLLRGFAVNRPFMEQMMNVKEPLPAELLGEFATPTLGARARDALRLIRTLAGLVRNHFTLPVQIRAFNQRLQRVLAPPDPPLELRRPEELVAHFRDLERQLLTRWDAPLVNDFFAMIFYGLLRKACARIDSRGTLQNDLLCAEGGIISTEPAQRICAMAALALPYPDLIQDLCTANVSHLHRRLPAYPELERAVQAYLGKFGQRCLEELKLESANLYDDPLPLLRSIGQLARRQQTTPAPPDTKSQLRRDAEARVHTALRFHPFRRLFFNWILHNTRARVRDRENLRFERTRLFGRVRALFLELGRRYYALDLLDAPRDILYLTLEEIQAYVEGTAVTTDLRPLVRLRQAEFAAYRTAPPPADRFATRGPVYYANAYTATVAPATTSPSGVDGQVRTGIGCCPGIVRGRARVITDPRGAQIHQGEILVALRTDPGWIMLFPAAAGVAVEQGSLLSHSAIVAREMGIPSVVSVPGLTTWLQDGDVVELDGKSGTLRKLPPEATP